MTTLRQTGCGLALAVTALALAGCGPSTTQYPQANDNAKQTGNPYQDLKSSRGSIFAKDGIAAEFSPAALFGGGDEQRKAAATVAGIQVNGYLWSAALDAVSFMPIESADADAGIIKTGWYIPRGNLTERLRVNVFILSGDLRDDGVRTTVFRQVQNEGGDWVDAEPHPGSATRLQAVILDRAKQLHAPPTR